MIFFRWKFYFHLKEIIFFLVEERKNMVDVLHHLSYDEIDKIINKCEQIKHGNPRLVLEYIHLTLTDLTPDQRNQFCDGTLYFENDTHYDDEFIIIDILFEYGDYKLCCRYTGEDHSPLYGTGLYHKGSSKNIMNEWKEQKDKQLEFISHQTFQKVAEIIGFQSALVYVIMKEVRIRRGGNNE